jgi:hypothetical protein
MSRTSRTRRLGSAACLVLAPALILIASGIQPFLGDSDTDETLQIVSEHMTEVQVGDLLAFAGILAFVPAMLAVMRALRNRAPALGLIGGALAVCGWVSAMVWVISDQFAVAFAEETALRQQIADAFDDGSAWVLIVVLLTFLVGILIGTILLAVGLLRARIVPVWAPVALIAAPVLSVIANGVVGVKALDLVATGLLLVGFSAVAWVVRSASDEEWERGEIATRTRVGAEVAPA